MNTFQLFTSLFTILIATTLINAEESFGSNMKFLEEPHQNVVGFTPSPTALDFDSYVFSMQLPKTQCFKYNAKKCNEKLQGVPKNTFTIHGLWPNFNGRQKEDCNVGQQIVIEFEDKTVEKRAEVYWVSLKDDDIKFWDHEFNKHGLCWNLRYNKERPEEFFRMVLNLYQELQFDTILQRAGFKFENDEEDFSYSELMSVLGRAINFNFDIKCLKHEGKQYLGDIFVNLGLDFKSLPGHIGTDCNKSLPISILFN